jgi:hypothetical protein
MAKLIAEVVAVRFLLADANVRQQEWYERQGWVLNRAQVYTDSSSETTVSMRLDLMADTPTSDS